MTNHINNEEQVEIRNARRKEQIAVMEKIKKDGVCSFCREHMEKYHENPILKETDYWYYTKNAWPYENTKHHFILIPKSHVSTPHELSNEEWSELREMVTFISKEHGIDDATFLMRFGKMIDTGATVRHLHAHIIVGDGKNPVITRVG